MARTTAAEIEAIINDYDSSIGLPPFISVANELVTELCTDSGYSDTRLNLVETWLAAHFYKIDDQTVEREKAGSVQVSYQYEVGFMFNQTKYGQQAMLLDTAGNLARLQKRIEDGKSANITFSWEGQDYSTEDPTD